MVVVGEQAAGSPTLNVAAAWAGTLQGEEGVRRGPCEPDLHAPHSRPFLVPQGQGLRAAEALGPRRGHWLPSAEQSSSSPALSAPVAPAWRCPRWRSAGGSSDGATPASVGPRTPWGSGEGTAVDSGNLVEAQAHHVGPAAPHPQQDSLILPAHPLLLTLQHPHAFKPIRRPETPSWASQPSRLHQETCTALPPPAFPTAPPPTCTPLLGAPPRAPALAS